MIRLLTPAQRRRTQIRLAQRAYRQRKEMTISSLQKQVEQLQTVIDGMNTSFLRFNDQAMQSDIFALRPRLASELKETTEAMVNLAKTAKTVASDDEREDSQETSEPSATPQVAAAVPDISSRSYQDMAQPPQDLPQPSHPESQMNAQGTHIGMGYYRMPDESETATYAQNIDFYSGLELPSLSSSSNFGASREPAFAEPRRSQNNPFTPTYPFRGINEPDSVNVFRPEDFAQTEDQNNMVVAAPTRGYAPFTQIPAQIPSPRTNTIQPSFTYSFQETTFARRLQRACLERAFHLLSTAHLRPSDFNRVFRLCRHYLSHDELLVDFRSLLQHSVLQPLDFLKSPFLHLGGAGTHYPARDKNGIVMPSEASWNIRRIGPWATKLQLEELRRNTRPDIVITPQLEEDLQAYGGEWLDSQDVEGYLEELGVHIDAQASFAGAAVKTLDALAHVHSQQPDNAHPDSEMVVLGEALDQFAPNHLSNTYNMSPPSQTQLVASPPQGIVPSSSSASGPGTSGGSSGTPGGQSTSLGPSTPESSSILQQATQKLDSSGPMNPGDFPRIDPTAYDEWDRFYDLDLAWMGNNQATLADYDVIGQVATGGLVEERRQNRTVTIDVQRFINGEFLPNTPSDRSVNLQNY